MLKWETRHSETLLNVEKLQSPFSYKLHIHRDGETRERTVDLPETLNYLLGLDVQTRRVYDDAGRRYLAYRGTLRNSRTVVVIWRETKDWTEEDYRRDRDFVEKQKLVEGADEIYTNGDSIIPGACSLDPIFKSACLRPWRGKMNKQIVFPKDQIAEFCRRHHIRRLAVFGSALRSDFNETSDIDILVEFEPDHIPGLLGMARMERELSALFGGRKVDLRTPEDLSRYFRQDVLNEAEVQYAQG